MHVARRFSLVLLLTMSALPAWATDHLALKLDWITEPIHMPFFLAEVRGWFAAHDLDISIEDGNGSTTTVQLIAAGNFDVGVADLSPMMIARAKGLPVVAIAGMIRKGSMGIVVPMADHITTVEDLVGKELLYTAGSLEGPFIAPFLRVHHITPDQVKLTSVQASAKASLYLSGHADAVVSSVPPILAVAPGRRESQGILFWDEGFKVPGFGIIARPAMLAERGAPIRRFVSIVCGAWAYILSSPEHMSEAARAVRAKRPQTPLSEQMLIDQAEAYRAFFTTDATRGQPLCVQSEADWAASIQTVVDAGVIPAGSKPAEFFTNDYIDRTLLEAIALAK